MTLTNYFKLILAPLLILVVAQAYCGPIKSFETPYTISKVTTAQIDGTEYIVASSYEGTIICYSFDGELIWENPLSGFFNHDIYCNDINNDGNDEILATNSNGSLYCINDRGETNWSFRANDAPMNAVTVIHRESKPYIVCGGYDTFIYYLNSNGEKIMELDSRSYSHEKGFGAGGPKEKVHVADFLRTAKRANGDEILVLQAAINTMSARGGLYFFEPLATEPYAYYTTKSPTIFGDLSINSVNPKQDNTIILGSSKDTRAGFNIEVDLDGNMLRTYDLSKVAPSETHKFGYRVSQSEVVNIDNKEQLVILFGSSIIMPSDRDTTILVSKYAYNDFTKDKNSAKLILASEQGGGNSIHIINLYNKDWQDAYQELIPNGNIAMILKNGKKLAAQTTKFKLPKWESLENRPVVYFMSESPNNNTYVKSIADRIERDYPSPIFLNNGAPKGSENPDSWQRDTLSNNFYKNCRDQRQKYKLTQSEILHNVSKAYAVGSKGMSMWGGHGNDPFYNSPATQRKIMSLTREDQQTVLIFPEMEGRGKDVEWLMQNYIYPLADHARKHNSKLYIRSKHLFWLGNVYESQWSRLISGEYADVFIPSMEETTDKSMELSLMGRMGIWMSGAVDSWGTRCARDNTSYNRLRQFSHQNLPNHFLRNMIYHISLGAQYIDNFAVDQEYMSILWEMIAKGLLYVPQRDEIVSINPVHLTMIHPDEKWLTEGNNVKWITYYDPQKEAENPWVMGRLSGSWPAAPTTEWDFSNYAAGAKERRLNFISSFNNGHVLITPPYDASAPRGAIEDYLHPMYKGITKEYFTDGRYYYADAERTKRYSPKEYYKIVEQTIEEGTKKLPLTVKGEVGWVAAQSNANHLRVTIIDGGYINPSEKQAKIIFGTADVKSIKNLATGENISFDNSGCSVTVPCGHFLFLDIELKQQLKN